MSPKADADAEDDADNADGDSADNTGDTHTVLICNLCSPKYPLSVDEYVKPVENIVKAAGCGFKTLHYSEIDAAWEKGELPDISAIILCGTALKDNEFAEDIADAEKFRFIRDAADKNIPILGICAGFQVLSKIFGGDVIGERDLRIGMTKAKVVKTTGTAEKIFENRDNFEVYELHKNAVTLPECFEALAVADDDGGNGRILAAKHRDKEIYGVLFHPEVRNEYVVRNFLRIAKNH
ncbi:MAG: gamma-glutamyl-gamma-aminobutyrate hydrolase family protein [Methanomicrobium sp.]|nr:gamma-glutamyl-gamma-aminobutyrate hydrolase family protein [Methanomicrobium sp.]